MRQMRKEGGDDRKVCDGFRRHGGERVAACGACGGQMSATVTAEFAGRYCHLTVRARDQGRSFERSLFAHPPPPLMYRIHAASSAAPSMLPQPVAKSHPIPASKARLLPLVTSWNGLAGNREALSPIQ